jgi:hypothetical protein
MHIAAGVDPLTARAALPRGDEPSKQSNSAPDQWISAIAWIVVAGVSFVVWSLL